jgi:F-type H+-transporting ATPase subunit delta
MFRGRLSDVVLDTLQVMNRHGRLELLHALHRAYVRRMEDTRGQIEVVATSAVELDAQQKAEVARLAEQLSGLKPLVAHVVDPGVLGGLVLRIGDHRYDNSLRRHLRAARERLLERSVRGAAAAGSSGTED